MYILRKAVYKDRIVKNARILTNILRKKLGEKYRNPLVSLTKTKKLLKNFCGRSYKSDTQIN